MAPRAPDVMAGVAAAAGLGARGSAPSQIGECQACRRSDLPGHAGGGDYADTFYCEGCWAMWDCTSRTEQVQTELEELKRGNVAMREELARFSSRAEVQTELEQLKRGSVAMKEELARFSSRAEVQTELQKLKKGSEVLKEELAHFSSRAEVQTELEKLKKGNEVLKGELAHFSSRAEVQAQVEDLRKANAALRDELALLGPRTEHNGEEGKLGEELARLRARLEELEKSREGEKAEEKLAHAEAVDARNESEKQQEQLEQLVARTHAMVAELWLAHGGPKRPAPDATPPAARARGLGADGEEDARSDRSTEAPSLRLDCSVTPDRQSSSSGRSSSASELETTWTARWLSSVGIWFPCSSRSA